MEESVYIKEVTLKNVRCFEDIKIKFGDGNSSVLITGNNGTGKSSILRAIAMGLCDSGSAVALLRELEGNFVRKGTEKNKEEEAKAVITIKLKEGEKNEWIIETTIKERKDSIIEIVEQKVKKNGEEDKEYLLFWNKLFLTAYGAGLRTAGTNKFSNYFAPDAVYPLFKYDVSLQDPEISWRRLRQAGSPEEIDKVIKDLLKHVLDLEEESEIMLKPDGISVKEHGEIKPLDAIGDGHKSLIKLTLDILLWYLLKINYSEDQGEERKWLPLPHIKDIRGIVIIDEIEQHLHPELQRKILNRLNEKFPKVQFIITTHSPLCVSGTADLEDKDYSYKIHSVAYDPEKKSTFVEPMSIPQGLFAHQVLVDYFDLPTTLSVSMQEDYKKLNDLVLKSNLSESEKAIQKNLIKKIKGMAPALGENLDERRLNKELVKEAKEIAKNRLLEKNPQSLTIASLFATQLQSPESKSSKSKSPESQPLKSESLGSDDE